MIEIKTRKWGNSTGVVLPKEELERLKIGNDETIFIDIKKKENPLKELFGVGKDNPIKISELKKMRREWESKY